MHTEDMLADEVQSYLAQVDRLRQDCERRGDFKRAQECVERMRDVNIRYARRVAALSQRSNKHVKDRIADEQRGEVMAFERMWADKMTEYNAQARRVLDDLFARHNMDYASQEGLLKIHIMNRRPRFSRKVHDVRDALERAIAQRKYVEADDLKKRLVALEQKEVADFDDMLAEEFERRTKSMKNQYVNEVNAVQQRIEAGRSELENQKRHEAQKIARRHGNVLSEMEQEAKLQSSKTKQYVERQVQALILDPVKTSIELRSIHESTADAKKGPGAAASRALRAKTPTPAASSARRPASAAGTAAADNWGASKSRYATTRFGW